MTWMKPGGEYVNVNLILEQLDVSRCPPDDLYGVTSQSRQ
jgi:hypothetical protein